MLPKKNKISIRMFPKERRPIKSMGSDSLSLSVFFQTKDDVPRASVVISKKIAKTAVERNKIRRRIFSILRKHITSARDGSLLVFHAKKPVLHKKFADLEVEIQNLLKKYDRP
ncbi:MAG: ribonuclease P protein component [Candidatus Zambryskibacteria bacterium RIFCSPHIGHO2_01_FULL_43_27]|uniref:Ribonuclease P protein component n=1 Tax=Candidatus Zambryskibacteria bacterium RIFCSPLOWO2_01_FULL_43_17 TaxID=1802760 RepID=A0A1G2U530_9BACT|nr:MAG: ribonuclease P protein component [Candidatus Zambryskibacteria bacterium RIFCSPHIGHO2_01_FULL_43_27]OHB00075.1 MAG: ribonuclease P protein component [Candidatus Zambryskibacteria bacterium RIFCSPHIGHO2_12_FULL_43_12b]OHB04605.1 MAG: ribonuclease P protein component [Candidatus Zambryskibacteria bacterium RIFCSPLOWO2_01_FULL_43_17]